MTRAALLVICGVMTCIGVSASARPQSPPDAWAAPVRLRAAAIDLMNGATSGPSPTTTRSELVQIVIERWSANDERGEVANAVHAGEEALVRALESAKRVGFLRYLQTDAAMPAEDRHFPLLYAAQSVGPDGTRRLVIATTLQAYPSSHEAPVKVIEMRFGADGVGEGRIAAADVVGTGAQAVLQLSNYTTSRRCLRMIRKE